MSRYKRRVIYASIAIHVMAIIAYFIYWLNTDPFAEKEEAQAQVTSNQLAEGETNENNDTAEEIPDTDKNPLEDYEEGDLSDGKIASLITNQSDKSKNLSTREKVENLNKELKGISRTSVKEVEKMTKLAERAFGIEKEESTQPIRERKLGEKIDIASMALYDFEIQEDGMYVLIYKDKNNIIIKNPPIDYNEMDPSTKVRLSFLQKAKENKKFEMLLNTTNSIIDKLHPPKKSKNDDEK